MWSERKEGFPELDELTFVEKLWVAVAMTETLRFVFQMQIFANPRVCVVFERIVQCKYIIQ